jgi:hypothetical protein
MFITLTQKIKVTTGKEDGCVTHDRQYWASVSCQYGDFKKYGATPEEATEKLRKRLSYWATATITD